MHVHVDRWVMIAWRWKRNETFSQSFAPIEKLQKVPKGCARQKIVVVKRKKKRELIPPPVEAEDSEPSRSCLSLSPTKVPLLIAFYVHRHHHHHRPVSTSFPSPTLPTMAPPPSLAFLPLPTFPRLLTLSRRRTHSLSSSLSGKNGLPNLRDLSSAAPHLLRPHRIYRGSTPSALPPNPSPESLAFLRAAPLLLDLRSSDERVTDRPAHLVSACGHDFHQREVHLPLLRKRSVVYGLARALPADQARSLAWRAISRPSGARKTVVDKVDEGGLILLNRILVEASATAIGRALGLIVDALVPHHGESNGPVYFYCSAGKDRTGLLAALILSVLGVGRSAIVRDYVKSRETWENGPYELREDYCGTSPICVLFVFALSFHRYSCC